MRGVLLGVDTVGVTVPVRGGKKGLGFLPALGWERVDSGWHGSRWWETHELCGIRTVFEGVGNDLYLQWEGSVQKAIGVERPATRVDVVGVLDLLETVTAEVCDWDRARLRRVDPCFDVPDPDRSLIRAASDWQPFARGRTTQAEYSPTTVDEIGTVFHYNKARGVRVYAKCPESGHAESEIGVTRIEVQLRKDWSRRWGLHDPWSVDWTRNLSDGMVPVVADLVSRL